MLERIEPAGVLVSRCSLPGEGLEDGVYPAHPSMFVLSANRWLMLYATRGVRCQDDDMSIVYQVRADGPTGPVLNEGFVAQQHIDTTGPSGDGKGGGLVTLLRHPMAFGVPRGAIIGGRRVPYENVFAILWSTQEAGHFNPDTGTYRLEDKHAHHHEVHWRHAALNEAGDDLVFLDPPRQLRQVGYEAGGPAFCRIEQARSVIQSLVPPLPLDDDAKSWVVAQHFDPGIAVMRFTFDDQTGRYRWTETGPMVAPVPGFDTTEAELARGNDGWLLGVRLRRQNAAKPDWSGNTSRDRGDTGWLHTTDLFGALPPITAVRDPNREAPMNIYRCADGIIRMFSGDLTNSPYKTRRNPLYVWDVDEHTFAVSNRKVVFDAIAERALPPTESQIGVSFAAVAPHAGGTVQTVAYRVMVHAFRAGVAPNAPAVTDDEFSRFGIYHARLHYREPHPPTWQFDTTPNT